LVSALRGLRARLDSGKEATNVAPTVSLHSTASTQRQGRAQVAKDMKPSSTEGVSSQIYIPDPSNFGAGSFVVRFGCRCFPSNHTTTSLVGTHTHVQIAVSVTPDRFVMAALRYPDGIHPIDSATFLLPRDVNQDVDHTLTVGFEHWHIYGALLDDMALARQDVAPIQLAT